jgi:hypothetical protein
LGSLETIGIRELKEMNSLAKKMIWVILGAMMG